jgi:hypothetical protein
MAGAEYGLPLHRGSLGFFLQSTGSCAWDGVSPAKSADGAVAAANDVPASMANSAIIRTERSFFHEFIKFLLHDKKIYCIEPIRLA